LRILEKKINFGSHYVRFNHKNPEDPEQVPGGFLSDCNPNSLETHTDSVADKHLLGAKPFTQYQFERIGFFSVDPDSKDSKV
jgi:glutaminyl-tRNA synthetase